MRTVALDDDLVAALEGESSSVETAAREGLVMELVPPRPPQHREGITPPRAVAHGICSARRQLGNPLLFDEPRGLVLRAGHH